VKVFRMVLGGCTLYCGAGLLSRGPIRTLPGYHRGQLRLKYLLKL
jgi:hypothetical protein